MITYASLITMKRLCFTVFKHSTNNRTLQHIMPTLATLQNVRSCSEFSKEASKPQDFSPVLHTDVVRVLSRPNVLDKCLEDVSVHVSPSFNLASYVDRSPHLQELIKLGVNLDVIERTKGAAEVILRLDFERDVKPYIKFIHDQGVAPEELGNLITKNPFIFKEDLENLQIRINYLDAKLFSPDSISRIITKNPKWLSHSTKDIDHRLGFFQSLFSLIGPEIRSVTTKMPKLITYPLRRIEISLGGPYSEYVPFPTVRAPPSGNISRYLQPSKRDQHTTNVPNMVTMRYKRKTFSEAKFSVVEEMGFTQEESKSLLMSKPKVYTIRREDAVARFCYIHNEMGLPHTTILSQPDILTYRESRIRERHSFLKSIGKAQYDPKAPGYVSLRALMSSSDSEFCGNAVIHKVATSIGGMHLAFPPKNKRRLNVHEGTPAIAVPQRYRLISCDTLYLQSEL